MRSGEYLENEEGILSFHPSPLPPDPPIEFDHELIRMLSKAERALGRLDGISDFLPNSELFIAMYVRQEATLSSQIEGARASLIDVLEYQAAEVNAGRVPDVKDIVNYVSSLDYGLEEIKARDITIELMNEIHEHLLTNTRGHERDPGKIREQQNWIGPPSCSILEAIYVPPPRTDVQKNLKELLVYIAKKEGYPVLLKCALAHSQFETIHPYLDGNGRMGRLLIMMMLMKEKALNQPVLYLSLYLKRNQRTYYALLQKVRDEGDWESWIKFFLKGIAEISEEGITTAKKIQALKTEQQNIISDNTRGNSHAKLLLDYIYQTPFISIPQAEKYIGISYVSANKLVSKLENIGILIEITGQKRNRIYQNKDYTDIFTKYNPTK